MRGHLTAGRVPTGSRICGRNWATWIALAAVSAAPASAQTIDESLWIANHHVSASTAVGNTL